jgi:hypothetical protein
MAAPNANDGAAQAAEPLQGVPVFDPWNQIYQACSNSTREAHGIAQMLLKAMVTTPRKAQALLPVYFILQDTHAVCVAAQSIVERSLFELSASPLAKPAVTLAADACRRSAAAWEKVDLPDLKNVGKQFAVHADEMQEWLNL